MSKSEGKLSVSENLDLMVIILKTVSTAIWALFAATFRGQNGHREFLKHVIYTAIRTMNARASARQLQKINPPTDQAYETFAKLKGFNPVSNALPHGAKAHLIGPQSASNILVFFHGGGFVYPAATQFQFLWEVQKSSENSAVILLAYSLAPGHQYPVQLKQAVALLRYLLEEAGKKPENIILGGDSAGANLVIGVLSHTLHPHPSISPLDITKPLKGAALISPWVTLDTSASSYTSNSKRDLISSQILKKWGSYYIGDSAADPYNQPLTANSSWWEGLQTKVEEILVTAGKHEVIFSDTDAFVNKLKKFFTTLDVVFASEESHDQPFMDPLIGEKKPSETTIASKSWIKSRL